MSGNRIAAIVGASMFLAGVTFATFSEMKVFLPALLNGAAVTIKIAALSACLFIVLSIAGGAGRYSRVRTFRWIAAVYVEIFRGTSLLVQLFWLFFVLPEMGILLSPVTAAVLGIGLNMGAYGSEVVRGGIMAVPKGQWEACTALNIPVWHMARRIIFPQALTVSLPGIANLTIELIKATSVVSAVTLVDITSAAVKQNLIHYRTVEIFLATLVLYYCLCQIVRYSFEILEARVTRYRGHA
jgi:polar amino acid transport system permease protein